MPHPIATAPTAKIAKALHAVMAKVSYVQKDGKNAFHGYRYASEAALLAALRPAMIEEGIFLIPSISMVKPIDDHGNTHVEMEYTLVHKDGEVWPYNIRAAGMGNDRAKNGAVGDKGVYKAITGANKYLLFKMFQIETGDDPENETPEVPAPAPAPAKAASPLTLPPMEPNDVDLKTYLKVIKLGLETATDEKAIRTFWTQEAENRQKVGIANNSEAFKLLKNAHAQRIAELKKDAE
jgi:hypothetical protein